MSSTDMFHTEEMQRGGTIYRHRLSTRIWHWTNFVALVILLMSGLMIFNAHPRLYWGEYGANPDPAWLQIGNADGEGYLRVGDFRVETTGLLGVWEDENGATRNRAFPGWATIPSNYNLALARRWHITFAWVFAIGILAYAVWSYWNRHIERDLLPTKEQLKPTHIWQDVKKHARLDLPKGEEARHYNVLQKLAYLSVLGGLIPLMVLTGLTMSPAMNASWPWLLDIFGGRQSARSIHFICAMLLVAFILLHLAMVVLAGPLNEIRSMITGRYRLPEETGK